jgi:hypothetical protein
MAFAQTSTIEQSFGLANFLHPAERSLTSIDTKRTSWPPSALRRRGQDSPLPHQIAPLVAVSSASAGTSPTGGFTPAGPRLIATMPNRSLGCR